MEPGQFARIGVTFVEDREGQAVVRLPNGSEATVEYGALQPVAGTVHLAARSAFCQADGCEWGVDDDASTRAEAELRYLDHYESEHGQGA